MINIQRLKNYLGNNFSQAQLIMVAYVLMQPFIDYYLLFDAGIKNKPFSITLPTLIRYLFSLGFFIQILKNNRMTSNRIVKYMLFYALSVLIYIILHHIYNVELLKIGAYSPIGEIMYLSRFILFPLSILYFYKVKISESIYNIVLTSLNLIISGSIVTANLFRYSLGTYSHKIINTNIFDWFGPTSLHFMSMASKGFFMYGNQISAILVFLFILLIHKMNSNNKTVNYVLVFLSFVALLMLGTKVSTYGAIIALAGGLIIDILFNENFILKNILFSLAIILCWINIYPFSPAFLKAETDSIMLSKKSNYNYERNILLSDLNKIASNKNENEIYEYVVGHYDEFKISKEIFEKYDAKRDPEFWIGVFAQPLSCRNENRCIQKLIADRLNTIAYSTRGPIDVIIGKLLGMGYTRMDSLFPIERDFISHVHNIGYVGFALFLSPVFIFLFLLFLSDLISFEFHKSNSTVKFLYFTFALGFVILAAYNSGNVMDALFTLIILSFFCAYFLIEFLDINNNQNFDDFFDKFYKGSKADFINEIKHKLKNNDTNLILTANPESYMLFESDYEFNKLFIDERTIVTPDGIGIVKLGKKLGYEFNERITGVDISQELLDIANTEGLGLAVLGAKQDVIEKFEELLSKKYPGIKRKAIINGYRDHDDSMRVIIKQQPDILLVALGMGSQEKLIYKYINEFKHCICVGVGGSIDVLSGRVNRAPEFFIKHNVEWLYRIMREPKRLKRFYNNNIKFLLKIYVYKLCNKKIIK